MVDSTEDKRIDFIVELLIEIRNLLLKGEQRMQELEAMAKAEVTVKAAGEAGEKQVTCPHCTWKVTNRYPQAAFRALTQHLEEKHLDQPSS